MSALNRLAGGVRARASAIVWTWWGAQPQQMPK